VDAQILLNAAFAEGFEVAGITPALPHRDHARYLNWVNQGMAADMAYLTDHRAQVRQDPRLIFPAAVSMLCVGKLYNAPGPPDPQISRYAWGNGDYHDVLREGLIRVAARLEAELGESFESRICVDTAPLLERSYARQAGLGWIGKNTCLINQAKGSWFFLAELLLPFPVSSYGEPPADRCGSCMKCIEACPTAAIVESPNGWELDSRLCISYWTIEAKSEAPADLKKAFGHHLFGCDICQDVCPWNRRAPFTDEPGFQLANAKPPLQEISEDEFRKLFRKTPVARTKASGYNRNVRIVLENGRK
jgi:epoxyqueuosine reductase